MAKFIMDVADVSFKRKSDGHVIFTSEAQMSSLSQTVDEETIQGGIGSRNIYTIKSNKAVELSVRNATFDLEWLAMTQGVAIEEDGMAEVLRDEKATVSAEGTITAADVTAEDDVNIINKDRKSVKVTAGVDGSITVPAEFAGEGETVTVIYTGEALGRKVTMSSDKFAEKYEVQYRTVVYDSQTEQKTDQLYINFHEVSPNSAFEMSLENGTAFTPELTFNATANDSNEIGTWLVEDITTAP